MSFERSTERITDANNPDSVKHVVEHRWAILRVDVHCFAGYPLL